MQLPEDKHSRQREQRAKAPRQEVRHKDTSTPILEKDQGMALGKTGLGS